MEIYLIRHTTPAVENNLCYGQADVPLSASFDYELRFLQKNIPKRFDAVFMSPSQRCRILAEKFGTERYVRDERLLELNFGEWEMKKWNDIDPQALNNWMSDFVNCKIPGGESFTDLFQRASNFFDEVLKKNYEKTAIITHAGVIRCFVAQILEIPLKSAFKIPVDYASITKLKSREGINSIDLVFLNKTNVICN